MFTENPAFVWELDAIRKLLALGVSKSEICRRCGKSRQSLYNLLDKEKSPANATGKGPDAAQKGQ